MYNQSDTWIYMTFNNNATKGIITKDIDSHTPFKHNRSLFGAPTRVRFFVTTAGAWKHSDLPAPVGATKKTSRFERMAFNASSWWVDEWLQECGLWLASGVSFRWRKLTLHFLIFRGFLPSATCLPLTFMNPKRIHVLFKSFFSHISIAKYASSSPRIAEHPGISWTWQLLVLLSFSQTGPDWFWRRWHQRSLHTPPHMVGRLALQPNSSGTVGRGGWANN